MFNGFIKTAAASPTVKVADTAANATEIVRLAIQADSLGVKLTVFPELSVTGATCGDLFLHKPLIDGAVRALFTIAAETAELDTVIVVGAPIMRECKLYNCAVVIYHGEILGVAPKKRIGARSERNEARCFAPAPEKCGTVELCGIPYPFGNSMLFYCEGLHEFNFACEIGEDLWGSVSTSAEHCRAGASIICGLAASSEAVGRAERRHMLVSSQSARSYCGYIYAEAGRGESTTDYVFGGHRMIYENGRLLAEDKPFRFEKELTVTDIDVCKLYGERSRDCGFEPIEVTAENYYCISFDMELSETKLTRKIPNNPFVPETAAELKKRCSEIMNVQVHGLCKRLEHTHAKCAVIGISGGLDSCLALIVSVMAMDLIGRPRTDVIAVTMPCFGTTERTRTNAEELCTLFGVTFRSIDIKAAVSQHFADIGHDECKCDVVYENAQSRERTQILMDVANAEGGMVIGTGDLSELCLGWATYNGDHMSMYNVNSSVPKTLIRHMVACYADFCGNDKLAAVLRDIVDTPVSPELLPPDEVGEISQKTEDLVGPYELHDFFLYYFLRYNFTPEKIEHMANNAFEGQLDRETVRKWLNLFLRRFFSQQFKRSCLPDGPAVGSVSVSPRGGLVLPSDAVSELWI